MSERYLAGRVSAIDEISQRMTGIIKRNGGVSTAPQAVNALNEIIANLFLLKGYAMDEYDAYIVNERCCESEPQVEAEFTVEEFARQLLELASSHPANVSLFKTTLKGGN